MKSSRQSFSTAWAENFQEGGAGDHVCHGVKAFAMHAVEIDSFSFEVGQVFGVELIVGGFDSENAAIVVDAVEDRKYIASFP